MAWYRAGTVSVTSGSAVVTGANTDFVSNTQIGEVFVGPDGLTYEIAQVVSATQIALADNYRGASGAGQGYKIQPTSSFARDLALGAAQLLNTFAAVRDGVGQGLFPDGVPTTPGIRFAADQDTGFYRAGANIIGIAAGGLSRVRCNSVGTFVSDVLDVSGTGVPAIQFGSPAAAWGINIPAGDNALSFVERQFGSEKLRIDASGNILAGVTIGNEHNFQKNVAQGLTVLKAQTSGNGGAPSMVICGVITYTPSGTGAAAYFGSNSTTNRSINASGTINASGADYAEYMTKADGCGTIAAGDVCGVDTDGKLTRHWGNSISFVVKSTAPSIVGGDVWGAHLGPKPEAPGLEPIAPGEAPTMPDDDAPEAVAAWRDALVAHNALVMAYPAEHTAWTSAQAQYETTLANWEEALETARQCVDRIAFCGQVPVDVSGDFAVGDYIVAVANGSGIKAVAIAEAAITFDQYRRRIGKVWTVRDGRAWIDVQHG